jgi:hypothetical protein
MNAEEDKGDEVAFSEKSDLIKDSRGFGKLQWVRLQFAMPVNPRIHRHG